MQVLVVGDVVLVDPVLVPVYPVFPDDVINQLFFEGSTELVDEGVFRNSVITILLDQLTQRFLSSSGRTPREAYVRHL